MHAYLIIGNSPQKIESEINRLTRQLKLKLREFPLKKIDDVRQLNSFTNLVLSEPSAILLKNVDEATPEALNAFLKNLEEPQENLFYFLTAEYLYLVLPTIVSRCTIIKTAGNPKISVDKNIEIFSSLSISQKISLLDKIKDREEALEFFKNLVYFLHGKLIQNPKETYKIALLSSAAQITYQRLKNNGNVSLHLTNFTVNTDSFNPFNLT